MKKKVSIIITATALVALIVVGSTLAFFTSQGAVKNTITTGDVKITLTEPKFKDSGTQDGDVIYMHDITPGQSIVKDPTITNTGSHDAYIRCKLDITGLDFDKNEVNATVRMKDLLKNINIDSTDWIFADGYYYYQSKLKTDTDAKFFDSVKIPEEWDNAFASQSFSINVTAEAIQADNFTPHTTTSGQIDGWNYSNGSAVPIESSSSVAAD
jgi:predicted ribosomally synthesized peptide with SipW-like signal peptide